MNTTNFKDDVISVSVELPFKPNLTLDETKKIEAELHYAVEGVLAKLFTK